MSEYISALIATGKIGESRQLVVDDGYNVCSFIIPAIIASSKKKPLLILEKGKIHTPLDYHRRLLFVNPYPQLVQDADNAKAELQRIIHEFVGQNESLHEHYLRAYFLFYPSIYQKGYRTKSVTKDLKEIISPILQNSGFLAKDLAVPSVDEDILIAFEQRGISLQILKNTAYYKLERNIVNLDNGNFANFLQGKGIIKSGEVLYEYKAQDEEGRHLLGEYFIDFRINDLSLELEIAKKVTSILIKAGILRPDSFVFGVANGSVSVAHSIAMQALAQGINNLNHSFLRKKDGALFYEDNDARVLNGKDVIFIEDVLNNGTTLKDMLQIANEFIQNYGAKSVSIVYLCDRGHAQIPDIDNQNIKIFSTSRIHAPSYTQDSIPERLRYRKVKTYKN